MNDDSTRGGETGGCRSQRQVSAALHHNSFVVPETHHAHRPTTAMAGEDIGVLPLGRRYIRGLQ